MITHVGKKKKKKKQWPLHWHMVWKFNMTETKQHLISLATVHQRQLPIWGLLEAVFVQRS